MFGTVLIATSVSSNYPSVLTDEQQLGVLTETYGAPLADVETHVDEMTEDVLRFTRLWRGLYGDESAVHRCPETGEVTGDKTLLPSLDELLSELEQEEIEQRESKVDETTRSRLEDLGYV